MSNFSVSSKFYEQSMMKVTEAGDFIFEGIYKAHSEFKHILNFINENGNIVSLAEDEKYLNPNTILINELPKEPILRIEITVNRIMIQDSEVFRSDVNKYDSGLNPEEINETSLNSLKTFISESTDLFHPMSLVFLTDTKYEENFTTKFQTACKDHMREALNHIEKGQPVKGLGKMKGAGLGLTPSGDDFTAGYLHALNLKEKAQNVSIDLKKQIYKQSLGKNPISNSMLFHAYKGACFIYLKDFLISVMKDETSKKENLTKLISAGETSGSDLLTGLYFGLQQNN